MIVFETPNYPIRLSLSLSFLHKLSHTHARAHTLGTARD